MSGVPPTISFLTITGSFFCRCVFFNRNLHSCDVFLSFIFLVLLHDAGHAFFVKKKGHLLNHIELKGTHGLCSWSYLHNDQLEFDNIVISWGGVLFQLVIALSLIICDQIGLFPNQTPYFIFINIFGYSSILLACINLIPISPLDGATAWKVFRYIPLRRKVSSKDVRRRS